MISRIKGEGGYSLIEVLVAIVILALAILPMVTMFEAGLDASRTSGDYDKARALASANLEDAKAMEFSDIESLSSCLRTDPDFSCTLNTEYVSLKTTGSTTAEFQSTNNSTPMIKVTVTVEWGDDKSYTTSGVMSS